MLKLVERIEFHERRVKHQRYIETRFYVKDVTEFIRLSSQGKFDENFWNYHMKRVERSKAKRPNFDWIIAHGRIYVYPRENLIAVREVGLHYICQHSFDLFPSEACRVFYESIEPVKLGKLYTLEGEELEVTSKDIHDGFMLTRKELDMFKDSFAEWIRHRRKGEGEAKKGDEGKET